MKHANIGSSHVTDIFASDATHDHVAMRSRIRDCRRPRRSRRPRTRVDHVAGTPQPVTPFTKCYSF